MRMRVLLMILCCALGACSSTGLCASSETSADRRHVVPWAAVGEVSNEGGLFFRDTGLGRNLPGESAKGSPVGAFEDVYACRPKQSLAIPMPDGWADDPSRPAIEVKIAVLAGAVWHESGIADARAEPNAIVLADGMRDEGFFKIVFSSPDEEGRKMPTEAYAVVCADWKKDLLAFLRYMKNDLESNSDPNMMYSSISVSHCDKAMEIAAEASLFSQKALRSLGAVVQAKIAFDAGACPELVVGLNKIRFKRFAGAPIEEFVVYVPEAGQTPRAMPLFLHVDPRRWEAGRNYPERSGLVDVWWHTVEHAELRWKNYTAFMDAIERKVKVDRERVYIEGQCFSGIAAIGLALNHPDQWAECSSSLGNSYRHMAGNAFNLPTIFVKGVHNEDHLVGYYDFAVKCFQYDNCRHFKNSRTEGIGELRGAAVPCIVREKSPLRVIYTIESLGNSKAYWVTVGSRRDENLPGTIDACVWGQTVLVRTDNIGSYVLDLVQAPLDANRPVEVVENGRSLGAVTERAFFRVTQGRGDAVCVKNERLHGPVWDVFTDPYVVVWGTGGKDRRFTVAGERTARTLAGSGPCFSDVNVPEELISSHNLVLVGTAESNLWLARLSDKLPVRVEEGCVRIGDKRYEGRDLGYMLVYPNPLVPERYVAVLSGLSLRAMTDLPGAYSTMKSIRPADIAIFDIRGQNTKWHMIEKLNGAWGLHEEWDEVLAETKKEHADWRWHQWIARSLRRRLKTDVVICEDPFQFKESIPVGSVTYRDLFNSFKNNWIVTVRMSGRSLRALLTVPFGSIFKREVNVPVIDGVTLARSQKGSDEDSLIISELSEQTVYTVALPEKCLNGQRMGLVLRDYDIVGQTYLVPTLRDYLAERPRMDIDEELDALKIRIF